MRTRWAGSSCAAVLAAVVVAGHTVNTQSSPSQAPAGARGEALPDSENAGQQPKVTIDGCLVRQASPTTGAAEFVLEDARVMPQDAVPARSATPAEPGAVATSGTATAPPEAARPQPDGEAEPAAKAFRLRGSRERGIDAWVGHRVTVVGVIEPNAADGDGAPVATVGVPVSPGSTTAEVREVEIAGTVTVLSLMPAQRSCTNASD